MVIPNYIKPEEMKEIMESNRNVMIVDVRGNDFKCGNIVGCKNIISDRFEHDLNAIMDELIPYDGLYFHCMLSQVRGPRCAHNVESKESEPRCLHSRRRVSRFCDFVWRK